MKSEEILMPNVKKVMRSVKLSLLLVILFTVMATDVPAQSTASKNLTLAAWYQQIVTIAAFTAK